MQACNTCITSVRVHFSKAKTRPVISWLWVRDCESPAGYAALTLSNVAWDYVTGETGDKGTHTYTHTVKTIYPTSRHGEITLCVVCLNIGQ